MSLHDRLFRRRVRVDECGDIKEKTVSISRTSKTVKGGRRFGFSALIVAGDGRGHVGYGLGKSNEVPDAIRKGTDQARKGMIRVPLKGTTVPHDVIGKFGPTEVMIKPGSPGTGVIAGSAVRTVLEAVGVRDVRTKINGSTNPYNVLYATFNALLALKEPEAVALGRGSSLEELGYAPF